MTSRFGRCLGLLLLACTAGAQTKSTLTLDDLFSSVDIRSAKLSPDGAAAVIATTRADWKRNRFRDDLWLWRDGRDALIPLVQSGHDSDPEWSPDGKRIAFISARSLEAPGSSDEAKEDADKEIARVWIIDVGGGEAFPLYQEPLKVHSFAWTKDSSAILFSVPEPLSKPAQDVNKREWKDVHRWREDERGDLLLELTISHAVPNARPVEVEEAASHEAADATAIPDAARIITRSPYAINEIAPAPGGGEVAFLTNSISGRIEHPQAYEIYLADLHATAETPAKQLTHNEGLESRLQWSQDGKQLYFGVFADSGSVEGKYKDVQGRLYIMDVASGKIQRLGGDFNGSWTEFGLTSEGKLLGLGQLATETQPYTIEGAKSSKLNGKAGSYEGLAASAHNDALLFRYSKVDQPTELFLVASAAHLDSARQITHLNTLFTERDLPRMKTFQWKSVDGKTVEGVLLYPPGKFEQKHLRMLTLIHGGPGDADGNKFGADWYSWAMLAAANGWLVFEPNYRGSTGYGDDFMTGISPHIVSVPGRDILSGVDALVKDGSADPAHLAIGGYSYGGYMTNWLITQTNRFRSAVTGAGAMEHAANWGNDDETFDDASYLGGLPWQNPAIYQSEAALFQFDKVRTPVHEVMGADDVRVSAAEGYLLERALDALNIPHEFLIFPGEGHGLGKDPWHGYIKVREELKWLAKYDAAEPTQHSSQ